MSGDGGASLFAKATAACGKALASAWAKLTDSEQRKAERQAVVDALANGIIEGAKNAADQAHKAVRGSSNDPLAQQAHEAAVILGNRVCMDIALQFSDGGSPPRLPGMLHQARTAYRAAITNDDNLDAMTVDDRAARLAAINEAVEYLGIEARRCAYTKFGVGTGAFTGRTSGRGDPSKR